MTGFLVKVILSYLLGSIVGSLLIGQLRGGVDIRRLGSGNAGGTNALRTQGKSFAFWVMVIDISKGWIATRLVPLLDVPGAGASFGVGWDDWVAVACGIAAVVGHVYPVWYGFRGGKGVATVIGAVLGLDPWMLIPMLVTWLAAVVLFGFVGLASMLGALALAVTAGVSPGGPRAPLLVFGLVAALLIAYTHRANIARMLAGTEPRARRLWLFGARKGGA
jgi:acyl phosphate:glycerol-3-phosphate acyltransferase